MKKRLILGLAALAAVTLTSCQKDQVINETPQQNAIEFGTYIGKSAQTKATSIDNTKDLNNYAFGVYAYYTKTADYSATESTPNFMSNQKVELVGNNWTYSPLKYWPNNSGDKVTFFAYAPYHAVGATSNVTGVSANNKTGDPIITFVTDATITNQQDLLFADKNNTNKKKQDITDKITFNFKHALSRIGFTAQVMIDKVSQDATGSADDATDASAAIAKGTQIDINEIEVIGDFYIDGYLNLNGGIWDNNTSSKISSYVIKADELFNTERISTTKTSLNKLNNEDKGYLMIIPKHFDGSNDANAVKIRVKYTVTTIDSNLDGGKSEIVNDITSAPFSINFQQGKAYNFALQLGMTSVKFDATVAAWEDGADVAVNVPLNF